jgi:hypothetical protein
MVTVGDGDNDGKANSKAIVKAAWLTLAGVALTAVATISVALINKSEAAQGGTSPTSPPPTSSAPSSASSTALTTSQTIAVSEVRVPFDALAGEFDFYGDMVWHGNGQVATSGGFELGNMELSSNYRIRTEFTRLDKNRKPFGKTETRQCPGDKPAPSWPEFTVELGDSDKVAAVKVVAYVDDVPTITFICPRLADCELIL